MQRLPEQQRVLHCGTGFCMVVLHASISGSMRTFVTARRSGMLPSSGYSQARAGRAEARPMLRQKSLRKVEVVSRWCSTMQTASGGSMGSRDRIYRRTAAGQRAWEKQDRDVPTEYRRILELVGNGTHSAVLRANLGGHPESHLDEWLANMEELGLIESAPRGEVDLDFTGVFNIAEVRAQLESMAKDKKPKSSSG
jgi:hypothetical protein